MITTTHLRAWLRPAALLVERHISKNAVATVRRRLYPMTVTTVTRIFAGLIEADVDFVVAGGWGIDALAGGVTRRHADVDLIVAPAALAAVTDSLHAIGFLRVEDAVKGGWWAPQMTVFKNSSKDRVEVLLLTGEHWSALVTRATELTGRPPADPQVTGRIGHTEICCLSASLQLAAHSGFTMSRQQRKDSRRINAQAF